jgi:hypothetical protein
MSKFSRRILTVADITPFPMPYDVPGTNKFEYTRLREGDGKNPPNEQDVLNGECWSWASAAAGNPTDYTSLSNLWPLITQLTSKGGHPPVATTHIPV